MVSIVTSLIASTCSSIIIFSSENWMDCFSDCQWLEEQPDSPIESAELKLLPQEDATLRRGRSKSAGKFITVRLLGSDHYLTLQCQLKRMWQPRKV